MKYGLADALGWDESTVRKHEEDDQPPDGPRLVQLRRVLGKWKVQAVA